MLAVRDLPIWAKVARTIFQSDEHAFERAPHILMHHQLPIRQPYLPTSRIILSDDYESAVQIPHLSTKRQGEIARCYEVGNTRTHTQ